MNKLSLIGAILGIVGTVLIALMLPFYGLFIYLFANVILGYVNKHDKNQIVMYVIYELIAIIGVINYMR